MPRFIVEMNGVKKNSIKNDNYYLSTFSTISTALMETRSTNLKKNIFKSLARFKHPNCWIKLISECENHIQEEDDAVDNGQTTFDWDEVFVCT